MRTRNERSIALAHGNRCCHESKRQNGGVNNCSESIGILRIEHSSSVENGRRPARWLAAQHALSNPPVGTVLAEERLFRKSKDNRSIALRSFAKHWTANRNLRPPAPSTMHYTRPCRRPTSHDRYARVCS